MIRFSDSTLRYLTVRESAAIQRFPDSFQFPSIRTTAMRLIGNAVATTVAEIIGRDLHSLVTGTTPEALPVDSDLRIARAVDALEATARNRELKPLSATDRQGLW